MCTIELHGRDIGVAPKCVAKEVHQTTVDLVADCNVKLSKSNMRRSIVMSQKNGRSILIPIVTFHRAVLVDPSYVMHVLDTSSAICWAGVCFISL